MTALPVSCVVGSFALLRVKASAPRCKLTHCAANKLNCHLPTLVKQLCHCLHNVKSVLLRAGKDYIHVQMWRKTKFAKQTNGMKDTTRYTEEIKKIVGS